jgi:hypothetical protein
MLQVENAPINAQAITKRTLCVYRVFYFDTGILHMATNRGSCQAVRNKEILKQTGFKRGSRYVLLG